MIEQLLHFSMFFTTVFCSSEGFGESSKEYNLTPEIFCTMLM